MPLQIHAVVQDAQYFDQAGRFVDTKHQLVPTLAPMASHMQCGYIIPQLRVPAHIDQPSSKWVSLSLIAAHVAIAVSAAGAYCAGGVDRRHARAAGGVDSRQKPRDTHLVDFRWSGPRRCGSWRLLLCRAGQGRLSSVVGVVGVVASGQLDEGAQVVGLQVFFAQAEENLFGYAGASQT